MHLSLLPSLIFLSSSTFASLVPNKFSGQSSSAKPVFAHFMVGNSYPYSQDDWAIDIRSAASKSIDAFVLNLGRDSWEPARVADAYQAAKAVSDSGTPFHLLISFDMTSLPCGGAGDADALRFYINTYSSHPNHFVYNGKPLFSTFAGDTCTFGQANPDAGWRFAVRSGPQITFVPAFFNTEFFPGMVDGAFNWNGGWPAGGNDITFDSDRTYLSRLGGKVYMAPVSPWFFTHYGPNTYNKNFIYRFDDWLFMERWELLVQNRDNVNIAQIITWNDYGESHYVGRIAGALPMSQSWTIGFDHQGWLELLPYYITAYKTGSYPPVDRDRIILWSRLYPAAANAPDDVGRPTGWENTQDYLWAAALMTAPANVTLSCGTSSQQFLVPKGVSKLKMPLATTSSCDISATVIRKTIGILKFRPTGFVFNSQPPSYNFNAFVAASP